MMLLSRILATLLCMRTIEVPSNEKGEHMERGKKLIFFPFNLMHCLQFPASPLEVMPLKGHKT